MFLRNFQIYKKDNWYISSGDFKAIIHYNFWKFIEKIKNSSVVYIEHSGKKVKNLPVVRITTLEELEEKEKIKQGVLTHKIIYYIEKGGEIYETRIQFESHEFENNICKKCNFEIPNLTDLEIEEIVGKIKELVELEKEIETLKNRNSETWKEIFKISDEISNWEYRVYRALLKKGFKVHEEMNIKKENKERDLSYSYFLSYRDGEEPVTTVIDRYNEKFMKWMESSKDPEVTELLNELKNKMSTKKLLEAQIDETTKVYKPLEKKKDDLRDQLDNMKLLATYVKLGGKSGDFYFGDPGMILKLRRE